MSFKGKTLKKNKSYRDPAGQILILRVVAEILDSLPSPKDPYNSQAFLGVPFHEPRLDVSPGQLTQGGKEKVWFTGAQVVSVTSHLKLESIITSYIFRSLQLSSLFISYVCKGNSEALL